MSETDTGSTPRPTKTDERDFAEQVRAVTSSTTFRLASRGIPPMPAPVRLKPEPWIVRWFRRRMYVQP